MVTGSVWAAHAETQASLPRQAASPQPRLSLAEAQQIAFERNWDLLAAKSGIDSAEAQLIVVKEFPNPTFSWSTAYIGTHQNSTFVGNGLWERNYDSIAAVSQLIEIAGKRGDRQRAARAGVRGARARFFDAKRTLDQGVTKAYVAALLANENVRVLNESAKYLLHEADIANARYKAGDISDADRKQIEINAEQYQLQASAAEATAVQARVAVEVLMGVSQPKGNWEPVDTLPLLVTASTPKDVDELPQGSRSDVLAAEQDLSSARENLKLQKAIRVPDPTISVQYEHQPPGGGPPIDTVGFGVSFPLPLWNRNGGNIKAAQAQQDQSAIALGKAKMQVMSDIANAAVSYKEASQRMHRYVDQIRPKAGSVRESVAFAYEKGGASLVDLLDAERTDNDVRQATAQAMSDTISTAADLKAAREVLPETELTSSKP